MHRPATIAFIVLTSLACATLVYCLRMEWFQAAAAAKFIASCGFLATAVSAGALQSGFGRIIFAGLLLSMSGDMFLIGQSQQHFLFGLISFLLAHVAYVTAFALSGQNRRWAGFATVPILLVALVVLAWLLPHVPANLTMPVRLYTAVISLMVIAAFGMYGFAIAAEAAPTAKPRLVVIGAVMFYVSDLSVAMQRIIETDLPTFVLGLPLYYAAQLCFAVSTSQSSSQ